MRFLKALILLVVLGAAALAGGAWWEGQNFVAPGPAPARIVVNVPPGSGLARVAADLEREGAVQNGLLFRIGVLRRGQAMSLKAGEYGFPPQASMARILDMLVRGDVIQHPITIAEGLTSAMAIAIVAADPFLSGETPPVPPEGSLLPETYLFQRGT